MNDLKPGWKSSESYIVLIGKIMVFVVSIGVISQDKANEISSHLATAIAGVFSIVALWQMASTYIQARTQLKDTALLAAPAASAASIAKTAAGAVLPFLFAALAIGALAGTVSAEPPRPAPHVSHTSLFGWREAIQIQVLQQRIAALEAQRQAPAPAPAQPPIIIQQPAAPAPVPAPAPQVHILLIPGSGQQQAAPHLSPPLQQIPIGGPPMQQIPIGGPPMQVIPIGGPPMQVIPIGPAPLQQIPIGGAPRQQIDPGTAPQQQIPLTPPGQVRPDVAPPPGQARPQPQTVPMPAAPASRPQQFVPAYALRR